ncbi:mannose-1-phosphate guanylyltransferase/mannose-6-phosphate isomerase [Caldichromatium japonicum]|uniref:mannose-1-phosphate guanylyltransferase n=1 Tax=Caldichromatium japonicum TaxID=2699430 RepID=A0A6G7VCF0_9GAMM|nr:mannose-1-phosphate guanylyltransferase/mannose-6-phosphate isomerase [Caldichromatium japonicum]QIK37555.1 mannose-1-phosphate guanylyltransferase/mannose-6-phosphate isomerase [Caldichromatium japonicum]
MTPLQPVILSGGAGTRLWPLSREAYPKQFLPLTSQHSMLQETVRRLDGLVEEHPGYEIDLRDPIVVCNESHRFLVAEQLRLINRRPQTIVLEPKGRNTAPALTLATQVALRTGEDPVLLVMPADHCIRDARAFRAAVADAYRLAAEGAVVTFGIVPSKPETGYGYIRRGAAIERSGLAGKAFKLDGFVEKPDAETANGYLATGDYFWNSGLFVLCASVWLGLIERFRPDIARATAQTMEASRQNGEFLRLDAETFGACPADSIDYAVMEPLARAAQGEEELPRPIVMPLEVGWSDVGAWSALWEVREQDESGNVLDGDTFVHHACDNLLIAKHRIVAAIGVKDLIIVETADAVLVASKDAAQDVKAVTQFLQKQQRGEYIQHQCVHRPWGEYESIRRGARYQVKRLTVKPGESLSLQMHHHRAEHWIVVSGTARVTRGDETFLLTENQSTYIPVGVRHRLENPGRIPLEIIEVQSGSYLGEDDILRFEDLYNRDPSEPVRG